VQRRESPLLRQKIACTELVGGAPPGMPEAGMIVQQVVHLSLPIAQPR